MQGYVAELMGSLEGERIVGLRANIFIGNLISILNSILPYHNFHDGEMSPTYV